MTTTIPQFISSIDPGLHLGDIQSIINSLVNNNAASAAYNITAAGTSQATATQLRCVINEVDIVASGAGVNLPSTKGNIKTPYRLCAIINNGANPLFVYPAQGTADTINGTSSVSVASGSAILYVSASHNNWSAITTLGVGNSQLFNNSLGAINTVSLQNPLLTDTPIVTYNTTGLSGAQLFTGIVAGGVPNTNLGFYGHVGLLARNPEMVTQDFVVTNNVNTIDAPNFTIAFKHSGSQFDLVHFKGGQSYDVYIDGKYIDHYAPSIAPLGTAQAGASASITLATSASNASGFYNTCYVVITGGTGTLGEVRQITAYSTGRVATVATAFSVTPDATTTYAITGTPSGQYVDDPTNSGGPTITYLNFNFGVVAERRIEIVTSALYGINIGANDSIKPDVPSSNIRQINVGDSFIAGFGGPFATPIMSQQISKLMGTQEYNQGAGSTGWVARNSGVKLNFMDRIAPPTESWAYSFYASTSPVLGGTYALSVTYAGTTQTTAPLAFNTAAAGVQAALNGLSNVPANSAVVAFDLAPPYFVLLYNMPGAVLTIDTSALTGQFLFTPFYQWAGVVAPAVPKDGNGNALPFILYVQGSGNDFSQGATAAQIQANATYTAQQIIARFPTAVTIFTGTIDNGGQGGGGVVAAGDISFNNAIKAAAALLPTINGNLPYIDPIPGGLGSNTLIYGSSAGTVAAPTINTNNVLRSAVTSGHPTGNGHSFFAAWSMQQQKALFGAV